MATQNFNAEQAVATADVLLKQIGESARGEVNGDELLRLARAYSYVIGASAGD